MVGIFASRTIKSVIPIMLLGATLNSGAVDTNSSGVLFSVRDYTKSGITYSDSGKDIKTLIEPFAYIIDGKLKNIPESVDQQQFGKDYYSNHRRYNLYVGGKAGGSVEVSKSAFDIQCDSLAAVAKVSVPETVTGMHMALASNIRFKDIDYLKREPTADERTAIQKIVYELYAKNKIPMAFVKKLRISNITTIEGKTGTMLIGSFVVNQKKKDGADEIDVDHAVFLIVEKIGEEQYRTTFTWFHSGSESDIVRQDLVDVLDIDGDGIPEIITQFGYYESVEYHVYRRSNSKWKDIYKNFGSGC